MNFLTNKNCQLLIALICICIFIVQTYLDCYQTKKKNIKCFKFIIFLIEILYFIFGNTGGISVVNLVDSFTCKLNQMPYVAENILTDKLSQVAIYGFFPCTKRS